ncbi:MAG: hypothetical protein Q9160_000699 [Pyrenula sp. 1 TL-2023]
MASTNVVNVSPVETQAPKLSAAEFRQFNRFAEQMEYYHNHFRRTWTMMYNACSSGLRPQGMSIRQFINTGLQFCQHIDTHHSIEENFIFPNLARKMPAFKDELQLLGQHKQIHVGLEKLEEYLDACKSGERELRLAELKSVMDTFGKVLWEHLDDEVKELGAENMKKYWTLEEMRMIAF